MSRLAKGSAARAGATAAAPLLVGVFPFALVAGAAPVAAGYDLSHALGLSAFVFAGASQLALIDSLDDGAAWIVAAITALSINLRMLLYSASLARPLAHLPLRKRLFAAYFLVDQVYALSIVRWTGEDDRDRRLPFYLAAGLLLGTFWLLGTTLGALVGSSVPEDVPLEFAVPLVFLVLLVPVLTTPAARAAAMVGGFGAVIAAEVGAARVAILAGGIAGIVAGTVTDLLVGGDASDVDGGAAGGERSHDHDPDPDPDPDADPDPAPDVDVRRGGGASS